MLYYPNDQPLYFDAVKIDPPKNKILEFNAAL